MRERWVRIVAGLTGMSVVLLAFAFAWLQNVAADSRSIPPSAPMTEGGGGSADSGGPRPPAPPAAQVEAGRALYADQGCALCHSIAGAGNRSHPLDGVGRRRDARALRDWMVAAPAVRKALPGRVVSMKQAYGQLSDAELDALVAYLQSLEP